MMRYETLSVKQIVDLVYGFECGREDPPWCTIEPIDENSCLCRRFGKDCAAVMCEQCLADWLEEEVQPEPLPERLI